MSEAPAPTPAGPTAGAASPPTPGPGGEAPAARRGRGRPFGSTTRKPPLTEQAVPAESAAAAPAGQSEPAPRRRRTKTIDKEALAKQLVSMHEMVARLTGIGLIQIQLQEGMSLAEALESVSREYDLALDGKSGAIIQLIFAAGCVYGPRVMLYQAMKKRAAQGGTAEEAATAGAPPLNGARAAS